MKQLLDIFAELLSHDTDTERSSSRLTRSLVEV